MGQLLRLMVSRHSAFYSPLIAAVAGDFLREEGLEASYNVLGPGQRSHELIRDGLVDVMQSAVSSNWKGMAEGKTDLPVHFAQINRRDGFFLVKRQPDPLFTWTELHGHKLLADHGAQPLAMLQYAGRLNGVDWSEVELINAGTPEQMSQAFTAGQGDYVHLQGPAAQEAGSIVAAVGNAMPPVSFSSLCCSRKFIGASEYPRFLRSFTRAKAWVRESSAAEVARVEAPFFPAVPEPVLTEAIQRYQLLGCWDEGPGIPRELYEQALTVFESTGTLARRFAYEEVVASD